MNKKLLVGIFSTLSLFLATAAVAAATTVTIFGNTAAGENQPGWLFNRDLSTTTPYTFTNDAASIGTGSLYVMPIGATPANKFVAENFLNTSIASINSITYDFKIGTSGQTSDKDHFYMNVYANFGVSDDAKFYDCRYNIVPATGSMVDFTTVTFDPTATYPVAQSGSSPFTCPPSPASMDSLSANSTIRMFALNVGDTSANDEGISGYLDKVVVNTDSDVTTYDFEPTVSPSPTPSVSPSPSASPTPGTFNKEDCKNGGWKTLVSFFFKNQGECVSSAVKNSHAKN